MTDHDAHSTLDPRRTTLGLNELATRGRDPRDVAAIQAVLVPGEQLLWCGRPGMRYRKGEAFTGAIVAVFALLIVPAARHNGVAALFTAMFAVWALWSLVLVPWDRAKLAYGV